MAVLPTSAVIADDVLIAIVMEGLVSAPDHDKMQKRDVTSRAAPSCVASRRVGLAVGGAVGATVLRRDLMGETLPARTVARRAALLSGLPLSTGVGRCFAREIAITDRAGTFKTVSLIELATRSADPVKLAKRIQDGVLI